MPNHRIIELDNDELRSGVMEGELTRETLDAILDEIAPVGGLNIGYVPRDEMNVWPPGEYSDYQGWVVTANASLELADRFAWELNEAIPERYYVEPGGRGDFYIAPNDKFPEKLKG